MSCVDQFGEAEVVPSLSGSDVVFVPELGRHEFGSDLAGGDESLDNSGDAPPRPLDDCRTVAEHFNQGNLDRS
ncbi:MAG: hypothetical protein ABIR68_01165 [Ilumatobacteraceae bacterium]